MSTDANIDDLPLVAGPLTMQLDRKTGFLRDLRLGDLEVLRGMYVAVRDRNWGTVKPHLSGLAVDQRENSFDVTFWVDCRKGDIDFRWKGEIRGAADGQIEYRMRGRAHSTFMRNRIGFCVLHGSAATAGTDCEIQHVDGICEKSTFPHYIAPHQPFMNVRAILHTVAPGIAARVICNGDTFETEDQRNWTDASFKTYCTPLALSFPVGVSEGAEIGQSIYVSLERESASTVNQPRSLRAGSGEPVPARIGRAFRFPRIGLCVASHGKPLSPRQQQFLSDMKLDHLRVDLSLTAYNLEDDLRAATLQAYQLNTTLQVAITVDESTPDGQLARLRDLVKTMTPPVGMWLVYDHNRSCTTDSTLRRVRTFLEEVTPDASFATGTDANFAELNRRRPLTRCADWIGYSVNPQVHAFDDRSIMETLEAQGDTVRTASEFAGSARICVSPITLKPRFNAVATGSEEANTRDELPSQVDVRQPTLFVAAWTLGSITALASAGAESLTFFETTGWRGLMELDEGCPLPGLFPSLPGETFPVGHLLRGLAGLTGSQCRVLETGAPLKACGFVVEHRDGGTVWLANLTSRPIVVGWPSDLAIAKHRSVRILDRDCENSVVESARGLGTPLRQLAADGVSLPEYALARIDYREQGL